MLGTSADCPTLPLVVGEVLEANDRALVKKYDKFILMNASIRGPFMPHW